MIATTQMGNEAASRRRLVPGRYGRQVLVPDTRGRVIADSLAKQHRGRTKDLSVAVEDKDFGGFLVDNDKRQAAVVR
jgi:hypothetical protein